MNETIIEFHHKMIVGGYLLGAVLIIGTGVCVGGYFCWGWYQEYKKRKYTTA